MLLKYEIIKDCSDYRLITYTCNGCYMLTVKRATNKNELIEFANKHHLQVVAIDK